MSQSDVVIRVEGLGKKYTIKHEQEVRHNTLRDAVAHQTAALGRWVNPFTLAGQLSRARRHADYLHGRGEEEFWALKDVSFEIRRGERVGIIGRNGAGKSTLLKILSRITEPTTGRVEIRGRVASLLEVGTGFHPELTGRENIYLNGAILGMTRREIRLKFDEIVDFAEVEKFLDTPVKRYSSGMYVRLAFAVAANLEPEILVVDEVLAVGDASFQKKCLGKMEDVAEKEGRTVLFVSHNIAAIAQLCSHAMLLVSGTNEYAGPVSRAIERYFINFNNSSPFLGQKVQRTGSGKVIVNEIGIVQGANRKTIHPGEPLEISFGLSVKHENIIRDLPIDFSVSVDTSLGIRVAHFSTKTVGLALAIKIIRKDIKIILCWNDFSLVPGNYSLTTYLEVSGVLSDWIKDAYTFTVEPTDYYGTGKLPPQGQGILLASYTLSILN